jgi:hypothetical protein
VITNRRDGTAVTKFSTGDNLGTNCSSFLLGIRVDGGKFTGRLLTRNPDGSGLGWDFDFSDSLGESSPAWAVPGTLVWNGDKVQLAVSSKSNVFDTVLTVELEK